MTTQADDQVCDYRVPFCMLFKTFVLGYILFIASLILIPTSYVNLNFQFTLMTWLVSTNESRKE